jgi:hypothetical protein
MGGVRALGSLEAGAFMYKKGAWAVLCRGDEIDARRRGVGVDKIRMLVRVYQALVAVGGADEGIVSV